MRHWEQYQHQVAGLLRELGFSTAVNDLITGANGAVHEIDVSARRTLAGIDLLWVVECKLWNRAIPKEKVATLQSIVADIGADRGLLISEKGFQPGAHEMAKSKNITLCSTGYLLMHAAEELLAARVNATEKRLMDLALRVNKDLRPVALQTDKMIAAFAARLPPEVVDEFASRPSAIDFVDGLIEVQSKVHGLTVDDHLAFMPHPTEMMLAWRPGVDHNVMDGAAAAIHYTTEALYRGRLGHWPAMCPAPGAIKLSWSMPQLIEVVESMLLNLEDKVVKEENKASKVPRPPWPHQVK
jgi:Restriction endonuclease